MVPYLSLAEFRDRTVMPSPDVDHVEAVAPGFIVKRLAIEEGRINARLRKRYLAPFATPVPDAVLGWLTDIVTEPVYRKRGFDPNDPQAEEYAKDAQRARDEVLEAANAEEGLFDLPLRQDTTATGIADGKNECLGYSEASPWVGFDKQAARGREEDAAGDGTGG